jgi:RNA polymerase sigma factor (sigma-70 family)
MGRTRPIEWQDMPESVRNNVENSLVRSMHVGSEHAMELVHEAAARLITRRVVPTNVEGLLFRTAKNLLLDELKQLARMKPFFTVAERLGDYESAEQGVPAPPDSDPAFELEERESEQHQAETLNEALKKIPKMDRLLLSSYHGDGRRLKDMAAEMNMTPHLPALRVSRARARLRNALTHGPNRLHDKS